ncbi:hypothetical protein [Bacillus sp. AG4(2022)]|uniref:hypothetical protein n=1 Tax=Bacillus sp. AG4(2022) TaxID=2962594 RepID=UPI00288188A3|nr:hypothetical protein [Bacillus sp. AG4(2022)]MDT0160306.1 hypothetical protein [Bacillus sp. AG4(2022)]
MSTNENNQKLLEMMMSTLVSQNEKIKMQGEMLKEYTENQSGFNDVNVKQLQEFWAEMQNTRDEVRESEIRSKRSEEIAIKSAQLAYNKVAEIQKHVKISDVQAEEIAALVGEKSTYIAKVLYPELYGTQEFSKKIGYVRFGLYSIIKRNINGSSSGSYKNIKSTLFDSAKDYIDNLTINDYKAFRNADFRVIKPFTPVEHISQEEIDIRELLEESLVSDKNLLS